MSDHYRIELDDAYSPSHWTKRFKDRTDAINSHIHFVTSGKHDKRKKKKTRNEKCASSIYKIKCYSFKLIHRILYLLMNITKEFSE